MAVDEERAPRLLFGAPVSGRAYTGRVGAYGVARSAHSLIAVVADDDGSTHRIALAEFRQNPEVAGVEKKAAFARGVNELRNATE
jgi:hypothetical protein